MQVEKMVQSDGNLLLGRCALPVKPRHTVRYTVLPHSKELWVLTTTTGGQQRVVCRMLIYQSLDKKRSIEWSRITRLRYGI